MPNREVTTTAAAVAGFRRGPGAGRVSTLTVTVREWEDMRGIPVTAAIATTSAPARRHGNRRPPTNLLLLVFRAPSVIVAIQHIVLLPLASFTVNKKNLPSCIL